MRLLRSDLVARYFFEAYAAVLLGLVTLAILTPPVVSAREAARQAVCTNNVRQHSGCHPDVVCVERGKMLWVSSCWLCGSLLGVQICFVEEKDGGLVPGEQAVHEGSAVFWEALERLRQYKLDRGESSIPRAHLARRYEPGCVSQYVARSATPRLLLRLDTRCWARPESVKHYLETRLSSRLAA